MAGRDITEGRSTRAIAVDLGIGTGSIWQNTGDTYDIAIGGVPFLLNVSDKNPYERATAPFRKQQFDSQRDPGEQSLSHWWIRSQSSFHSGEGVNFYDPFANPFSTTLASNSYRYNNSLGVEVFDVQGQATLLRRPTKTQNTSSAVSISTVSVNGANKILMQDDGALKLTDGTTSAMTTLSSGVATTIYASTNDGTNAYYMDAAHIVSVPLTGGSTSAVRNVSGVSTAVMGYVKERLVVGINNILYEIPPTAGGGALPSPVYTHPNTSWRWTSIAESGAAIYAAGYVGDQSSVFKFNLDSAGAMPVLTSAITAAVMPKGEVIHSVYVHLMTYIMIGTNKGVRVGLISDATGNITYGPLIIHTEHPVHGFTAHDSYVYCASSLSQYDEGENYPGLYCIDLSNEIDTLRFAYSSYIYAEDIANGQAVDVCHLGKSNQLAFICGNTTSDVVPTSSLGLYVQSATEVYSSGWIQTGFIRFNTLEQKNFKRVVGRGDFGISPQFDGTGFTKGSMSIASVDMKNNLYEIVSYDNVIGTPESTITQPSGAQDAIALRFTLYRDATDHTLSPVFKGYQLKAVPATPRSRMIKIPLMNFDTETDKYNSTQGWEGRAFQRLAALEDIEAAGDVVTYQDFRTGETMQCLIEEIAFVNTTPPDKKLTNFGGLIQLTIRTV